MWRVSFQWVQNERSFHLFTARFQRSLHQIYMWPSFISSSDFFFFLEDILGFIFSNFQLRSKCNSQYFLFTFQFSRDGSSHACSFCCCEDWFEAIGDRPGWAKRGEAWISNKDFAWIIDDRLIVRMLPTKTGRIICLHSLTLIIFHKMIQNREKTSQKAGAFINLY